MEITINANFRNLHEWRDSKNRSEHIIDRMKLRGIGEREIQEAVQKGAKFIKSDKSIVAEYRWYKIIYREYRLGDIRKIYPITVMQT